MKISIDPNESYPIEYQSLLGFDLFPHQCVAVNYLYDITMFPEKYEYYYETNIQNLYNLYLDINANFNAFVNCMNNRLCIDYNYTTNSLSNLIMNYKCNLMTQLDNIRTNLNNFENTLITNKQIKLNKIININFEHKSGKTFIILTLIKLLKGVNIIIVPRNLLYQYKVELEKTNITSYIVTHVGNLNSTLCVTTINNPHLKQIKVDNVFIDEYLSLNLTNSFLNSFENKNIFLINSYYNNAITLTFNSEINPLPNTFKINLNDYKNNLNNFLFDLNINSNNITSIEDLKIVLQNNVIASNKNKIERILQSLDECQICLNTLNIHEIHLNKCCNNIICDYCLSILVNCPYCRHKLMKISVSQLLNNYLKTINEKVLIVTNGNINLYLFKSINLCKQHTEQNIKKYFMSDEINIGIINKKSLIGFDFSNIKQIILLFDINLDYFRNYTGTIINFFEK